MAIEEEVVDDRALDEALTESIRANLKEIQSRPEETTVEIETPEAKAERARDETGKFTKTEKQEEKQVEPSAIEKPIEAAAEEQPLVTTTGQPLDINRPPASWKPAAKAQWSALPEPIRQEIYRRESDFLNGNKGIRENADFGQTMKSTIEPYRMLIEAEGGTPEKAVADLFRTAALFRTGTPQAKLQALFNIDQQFNAGLNQFFQQKVQEAVAQATGQSPKVEPHQPVTDPRVDQILASMQAREREQAAHVERQSNAAVETFIAAKDDKGTPLYPFVDNVLEDMSARVSILRRNSPTMEHSEALKQAYDAAVWANPETRAVLIGQQQATASQPAETLRKVEQAKRASAVNVPKRGALPATGPAQSLDETIRDTGRALGMF